MGLARGRYLSWGLLLAIAAIATSCRNQSPQAHATAPTSVTIAVSGMTCNGCAQTIRGELEKLAGVEAVKVSFAKKQAEVKYHPDTITVATLMATIDELGYKASPALSSPATSSSSPKEPSSSTEAPSTSQKQSAGESAQ